MGDVVPELESSSSISVSSSLAVRYYCPSSCWCTRRARTGDLAPQRICFAPFVRPTAIDLFTHTFVNAVVDSCW